VGKWEVAAVGLAWGGRWMVWWDSCLGKQPTCFASICQRMWCHIIFLQGYLHVWQSYFCFRKKRPLCLP